MDVVKIGYILIIFLLRETFRYSWEKPSQLHSEIIEDFDRKIDAHAEQITGLRYPLQR
jgi:hypothetical protein